MASMFFSLKETAQKLGKSEDEVRQLVKDGKLREFRDGANLLFKIDEVNALVDEGIDLGLEAVDVGEAAAQDQLIEEHPAAEQPAEVAEGEPAPMANEDLFILDEEPTKLEPTGEAEATSELGLAPEETTADQTGTGEEELLFLADDDQAAATGSTAGGTADSKADATGSGTEDEISLAAESGVLAAGSDITDADTALTAEGVNVLGESSTGLGTTGDSMAETAAEPASSSGEASLEEIEDDVSLDSFGSGSGLLDLSLQADDTSLGGILDEIYTSEGGGEAEGGAEAEPAAVAEEGASFDEITGEAEHAGAEEELPMPEPVAVMPPAMGVMYAEAAPDAQSNILGMLLFLPMLVLLYTAIVAVAGLRGVTPSILSSIQGIIWYLLGGAVVISLIVVAASFMAGRERSGAPAREKKVKAKKEKKAKAEKPAKTEKPAKEKKSFFGKKKK